MTYSAAGGPVSPEFLQDRRSLPDDIYLLLRDEILGGKYRSGEPLRQDTLAKRFDVSRIPIREALGRLQSNGLLLHRPRRGFVVLSLDLNEIVEIFELRMILEEHLGRIAARVRTEEDIAAVRTVLETLERIEIKMPSDIMIWLSWNRNFHSRLFESSKREHFCKTAEAYRDMVERYVRVDTAIIGDLREANREHRCIFDAFARGDSNRTGQLCSQHSKHTADRLVAVIEARGKQPFDGAAGWAGQSLETV